MREALDTLPKLCSTDVALMLRERYEEEYGIYPHDAPGEDRPLALVALQWAEDATTGSLLYERLQEFADKGVGKIFNISLDKFLELPTDTCLKMFEIASKLKTEEGKIAQNLLDGLGQK